jgi:hypothetical protein
MVVAPMPAPFKVSVFDAVPVEYEKPPAVENVPGPTSISSGTEVPAAVDSAEASALAFEPTLVPPMHDGSATQ